MHDVLQGCFTPEFVFKGWGLLHIFFGVVGVVGLKHLVMQLTFFHIFFNFYNGYSSKVDLLKELFQSYIVFIFVCFLVSFRKLHHFVFFYEFTVCPIENTTGNSTED